MSADNIIETLLTGLNSANQEFQELCQFHELCGPDVEILGLLKGLETYADQGFVAFQSLVTTLDGYDCSGKPEHTADLVTQVHSLEKKLGLGLLYSGRAARLVAGSPENMDAFSMIDMDTCELVYCSPVFPRLQVCRLDEISGMTDVVPLANSPKFAAYELGILNNLPDIKKIGSEIFGGEVKFSVEHDPELPNSSTFVIGVTVNENEKVPQVLVPQVLTKKRLLMHERLSKCLPETACNFISISIRYPTES